MKTAYEALVAIDVPHYGWVNIEAASEAGALTLVKAEARDAPSHAEWDNAHSLRIIHIENGVTGDTFAEDIELGGPMAHLLSEKEDRLFRAGPDLLAALEGCLDRLEFWTMGEDFGPDGAARSDKQPIKDARAAIAKAKED